MRPFPVAFVASFLFGGVALADALPACRVGLPVSVLACINYPGHIVARDAAKGTWKVQCDSDKEENWISANELKRVCTAQEAVISEKYFIGKWEMFTGGGVSYTEHGGDIYRHPEAAVKTPPLSINPDGTYAWTDYKNTWKGRWRALKPAEMKYAYRNEPGPAVLLMKAEDGVDWQVTRQGTNESDNRDRILIERMDLGLTYRGVRLK